MKDLLVGATGFVGGNLIKSHEFSVTCHSTDITNYYGMKPDLCVYAGVPAAMFLANSDPEADLAVMSQARENIRRIEPKRLVLISSIAVYADSRGKDETSEIEESGLLPYGRNRLQLERWIREDYPDALIVRLPALYGIGLKKNFLYDLHTVTPAMLKPDKYDDLKQKCKLVEEGYSLRSNGFYCLNHTVDDKKLREFFSSNDFNALSFTDSRSKYQFYNLARLWHDIQIGYYNSLNSLNLCTPPISAKAVYEYVTGKRDWINEISGNPFDYDLRSIHSELLGCSGNYLCSLNDELDDIKKFMSTWE